MIPWKAADAGKMSCSGWCCLGSDPPSARGLCELSSLHLYKPSVFAPGKWPQRWECTLDRVVPRTGWESVFGSPYRAKFSGSVLEYERLLLFIIVELFAGQPNIGQIHIPKCLISPPGGAFDSCLHNDLPFFVVVVLLKRLEGGMRPTQGEYTLLLKPLSSPGQRTATSLHPLSFSPQPPQRIFQTQTGFPLLLQAF